MLEITLAPGAPGAPVAPGASPYPRLPGQFACLTFVAGPTREQHPFTISSGPDAAPRFSIKASGDFTKALGEHGLPDGSLVRV